MKSSPKTYFLWLLYTFVLIVGHVPDKGWAKKTKHSKCNKSAKALPELSMLDELADLPQLAYYDSKAPKVSWGADFLDGGLAKSEDFKRVLLLLNSFLEKDFDNYPRRTKRSLRNNAGVNLILNLFNPQVTTPMLWKIFSNPKKVEKLKQDFPKAGAAIRFLRRISLVKEREKDMERTLTLALNKLANRLFYEENQGGVLSVPTPFSLDEAWILDYFPFEDVGLLNKRLGKASNEQVTKLGKIAKLKVWKQLHEHQLAFPSARNGDLLLYDMPRKHNYYRQDGLSATGKIEEKAIGPIFHAGVFVTTPKSHEVNELGGITQKTSPRLHQLALGEESYIYTFRFILSKMISRRNRKKLMNLWELENAEQLEEKLEHLRSRVIRKNVFKGDRLQNGRFSHILTRSRNMAALNSMIAIPSKVNTDKEVMRVAPSSDASEAKEEHMLCSEFAFCLSVYWLQLIDQKLREKLDVDKPVLKHIPQLNSPASGFHPGKLHKLLKEHPAVEEVVDPFFPRPTID